jgi:hypothetical protein
MSYHETFEFFAIDRLLSPDEMRALRAISTRAVISPARFYNFYNWGGLKGDPREMLARYFDLFVHTGNGRPDWAMLRFPKDGIHLARWKPYVTVQRGAQSRGCAASITPVRGALILDITPDEDSTLPAAHGEHSEDEVDENGEWDDADDDEWYGEDGWRGREWYDDEATDMSMDETSWPVPLALVRADLLAGDMRPLHLLWLLSVQCGERRAATLEPPRPAGEPSLTGSQYLFAELLRLNADLVAVALEAPEGEQRTAGDLLAAARAHEVARTRAEAERVAAERRERLDALAERQEVEWSEIDDLLDSPKVSASTYRDVIDRLTALRELADDRGEEAAFQKRLGALLEHRGRKPTLLRHVREARLMRGGRDG